MTDAALPVTQSAVEAFTEQYLWSLGCTIEKQGDTWSVLVPDDADTEVLAANATLICANDRELPEGNAELLNPECQFFQEILVEATQRTPAGKIELTAETVAVEIPAWLKRSDVEVRDVDFAPYYDRTALVVLFRVGIETVSEYQREFLHAIALDARSREPLRGLEETFLGATALDEELSSSAQLSLGEADVRSLLDDARTQLLDRVQVQIDEIHEEASRAADAEVEEYRQLQVQLIRELEERHANLSSKIDELSNAVNDSGQMKRVEALKERKQLKTEFDQIESELEDSRQRREQGFPERQQEIRQRHALDVRISPLTITQVEYERGEIELELREEDAVRTVTAGYGIGIGVTEAVHCSSCGRELTEQNPLRSILDGLQCQTCY